MKWKPIIDNECLKIDIERKIDEIYNSIVTNIDKVSSIKLYEGKLGIYLFLIYYGVYKKKAYLNVDLFLEEIIDEVNNRENISIYDLIPYAELGWLICNLKAMNLTNINVKSYFEDIENDLVDVYKYFMQTKRYDCLNGGISFGLFFLNYSKSCDISQDLLFNIIDEIKQASEEKEEAIMWESEINHSTKEFGYNLGIAHGIPGMILFLIKMNEVPIFKDITVHLLKGACKFILSQIQDINIYDSYFSGISSNIIDHRQFTRLGWCYGDLSVGYALYMASISLKELNYLKEISLEILLHTTKRRDLLKNKITDACLCHGTSGIAFIYSKLFMKSGLEIFKDSAQYWYLKTMEMASYKDKDQYAGFYNKVLIELENTSEEDKNLSFLDGISGVGLSLISSISSFYPKWDESLLL